VPNSPTSKLGSMASCRGSAVPVVTSTLRVSVRSVTGLSLASARMSWTLFFSPASAPPGGPTAHADPTAQHPQMAAGLTWYRWR
jgi:hypothetical protein